MATKLLYDKIALDEWKVRLPGKEAQMLTGVLGGILGTIFYGGLLAICMFLLGQLLPVFYVFVSEGL